MSTETSIESAIATSAGYFLSGLLYMEGQGRTDPKNELNAPVDLKVPTADLVCIGK